jgi:CPA2 family monovalent cation:H+ antiporter-2
MTTDSALYRDLAYVFVAAVLGGMLARRLRQPVILGYVLGGILIGPFTPGPTVSELHALESFAEIGVILLMYSIGIEFSPRDLLRVKWVAAVGGPIGIVLSVLMALGIGRLLGWSVIQAVTVGAVISVASTMVLSRLLIDRGELRSQPGQVMIGITLMEDLAVVVMTVLIPAMGAAGGHIEPVLLAIGKALLLLIPIGFAAFKLVPPLMTRVARMRSQELYLLVALAIGFATAAATQAIGLSLALGAFLAGMVISGSQHEHETLAQLLPIRDAFVALFFVTMGALINPKALLSTPSLLAVMVALIVGGKFLIWTFVTRLFGYPFWTAVLVGVGLTQIGEFSYVLVQVARNAGLVGAEVYNATLAASLITILLNAVLIRTVPQWVGRYRLATAAGRLRPGADDPRLLSGHVVLCGFGRVGSVVGTALDTFQHPYGVIEMDPDIVKSLRDRGVPALFGDPAHASILEQAAVRSCDLVVIALPEKNRTLLAIRNVRAIRADVPILARAHRAEEQDELLRAGATQVIQPEVEASATLIRHALNYLQLPEQRTAAYLDRFREAMEAGHPGAEPGQPLFPTVRELTVPDSAVGESLGEGHFRERYGVTVVAVSRRSGDVVVNPPAETRLNPGDRVRVFGLPDQIDIFLRHLGQRDSETG